MYETPWHERPIHFENARAFDQLREFDHFTYLLTGTSSGLTEKKLESHLDETTVPNVLLRLEELIWDFHLNSLKATDTELGRPELLKRAFDAGLEFSEHDQNPFQTFEDTFQKLRQTRVLWRSSEKLLIPVRCLRHQIIFELSLLDSRLNNPFLTLYLEWIHGFISGHFSKNSLHYQVDHFSGYSRVEVTFAK